MKIELMSMLSARLERVRLNPYSNGMKIELMSLLGVVLFASCLNPYSNGMKIERVHRSSLWMSLRVLILILME